MIIGRQRLRHNTLQYADRSYRKSPMAYSRRCIAVTAVLLLNVAATTRAFVLRSARHRLRDAPSCGVMVAFCSHSTKPSVVKHQAHLPVASSSFYETSSSSSRTVLHDCRSLSEAPVRSGPCDRRQLVRRCALLFLPMVATVAASSGPSPCSAATALSESSDTARTVWLSGKPPKVPGVKAAKDSGDTTGTRKDPRFLRSVADCKNQCENSGVGPDGYAKTKEECLSECQDICCTTYEQCTFAIVPRI